MLGRSIATRTNKLKSKSATVGPANDEVWVRLEPRAMRGSPKRVLPLFDRQDRS